LEVSVAVMTQGFSQMLTALSKKSQTDPGCHISFTSGFLTDSGKNVINSCSFVASSPTDDG
jgi:hypothetical protein